MKTILFLTFILVAAFIPTRRRKSKYQDGTPRARATVRGMIDINCKDEKVDL